MPLSDIRGQDHAVALLRAALRGERLHHSYLLTGFPGVGVPELATCFAQALLCPQLSGGDGCGVCSSCDRAHRGLHPDLLVASVDREGASREVKIEAVRALCAGLQLRPSEGLRKVGLVLDADRLTPAAQNALLKTLEEPPPHTVLILACESEERLLPTVRSRCLRVALRPLPDRLIAEDLQTTGKMDPETANLVARLARGSRVRAKSFGQGFRERRASLLNHAEELLRLRGTPAAALAALDLAEAHSADRAESAEAIEVLSAFWRDLLVSLGGDANPLLSPDREAALRALAKIVRPAELVIGLDALREAAIALEGNGAPRLQLEAAALVLGGVA